MAFTRFHDDPCRVAKQLQQSTDQGRWILNVPGNGDKPSYMADPQVRIQTWGGNLMTNSINLESELKGVNRPLSKDCLGKDQYQKYNVPTQAIQYPTNTSMFTEESRTIMPAWTARDLEQVNWYMLPLNPQENTCMSFENNLSTRILEKDNFVAQVPCTFINPTNYLPLPSTPVKGKYIGGTELCTSDNSCDAIRSKRILKKAM
uniref:Uncharacterized protein n=1 Tax=viral metagenome TaxID=1070528 RepID=A0A6C0EU37_9ZZZZ